MGKGIREGSVRNPPKRIEAVRELVGGAAVVRAPRGRAPQRRGHEYANLGRGLLEKVPPERAMLLVLLAPTRGRAPAR